MSNTNHVWKALSVLNTVSLQKSIHPGTLQQSFPALPVSCFACLGAPRPGNQRPSRNKEEMPITPLLTKLYLRTWHCCCWNTPISFEPWPFFPPPGVFLTRLLEVGSFSSFCFYLTWYHLIEVLWWSFLHPAPALYTITLFVFCP